jgi:hypothetical protein
MTLWAWKRVPRASRGLPLPTALSPEAEAALSLGDSPFPSLAHVHRHRLYYRCYPSADLSRSLHHRPFPRRLLSPALLLQFVALPAPILLVSFASKPPFSLVTLPLAAVRPPCLPLLPVSQLLPPGVPTTRRRPNPRASQSSFTSRRSWPTLLATAVSSSTSFAAVNDIFRSYTYVAPHCLLSPRLILSPWTMTTV